MPALEAESDRLTAWLRYGISAAASASASGGSGSAGASSGGGNQGSLPSSAAAAAAAGGGAAGGSGASYVPSSWVSMNPDFQQVSVIHIWFHLLRFQSPWRSPSISIEQQCGR